MKYRRQNEDNPQTISSVHWLKSTLIKNSLYKDITWVLVGYLGKYFLKESDDLPTDKELRDTGSWTAFMKETASANTVKCKLEYLPVIP